MKFLKYKEMIEIMDELHQKKLYELECWISLKLDTGFMSKDFERLTREDIVDGRISGFYFSKCNRTYSEVKLSDRSLSLLEYLPCTGVLFPKNQGIYREKVRKYMDKKIPRADLMKTSSMWKLKDLPGPPSYLLDILWE